MTEDRAKQLIREAADIMTAYPVETERLYLRLFTPDETVVAIGAKLLRIVAFSEPCFGLMIAWEGVS